MQTALFTLVLPVAYAFATPVATWGIKCVRADRSIYCLGGLQEGPSISTKMYHLDVSTSWDAVSPPWIDISNDNATANGPFINSAFAGAATLSDHSSILINGGATTADLTAISNGTALFDTRTETWTVPAISDRSQRQPRYYHSLVSDGQGRIWIWGGQDTHQYYNTWAVIDTTTWSISYPDIANPPVPRIQHTATLIPDGKIIIIGGLTYSRNVTDPLGGQSLNPVSMADILLFDMATAKWTNLTAGGNIPAPRREHTAILSRHASSIIVFGGGDPRYNDVNMNDVFVLNLTSLLWSSPSTSNVPPPPRKSHEAILVKDSMLIMFGYDSQGKGYNDLHVMDTSSWTWITQYDINDGSKDTESMGSTSGANRSLSMSSQVDLTTKALFGSIIMASILAVFGLCCVIGNIIINRRSKSRVQSSKTYDDIPADNFLEGIREIIRMGALNSRHHLSATAQKPDHEEENISSQKPNELDTEN